MDWYLSLIIYFVVGIVQDFLLTLNWRYVAKERPLQAVSYSFLTTVVSWLVFYNILTGLESSERSIIAIIIYSVGVATGTYLAMKLRIGSKK